MRPVKIQLVTGGILMAVLVGGMGAAIQSQYTPPEIERGVWNGKEIEFVKGHVILKFKQDKTLVQIEDHLQTNELKLINDPITSRTIVAEFSDSSQTIQKRVIGISLDIMNNPNMVIGRCAMIMPWRIGLTITTE